MRLLFQGDSVTDSCRDRLRPDDPGGGYVAMIAAALSGTGHNVINRGVAGDRVQNLEARWQADCLSACPDVVTILIGINDVWRQMDSGVMLDLGEFKRIYHGLIERTLPVARRMILMEPFLVPSTPENAPMRPLLDATIQVVRTLAGRHALTCVPLDGLFAAACAVCLPSHWAADGVHPSQAGHRLIARAWLETYQSTNLVP